MPAARRGARRRDVARYLLIPRSRLAACSHPDSYVDRDQDQYDHGGRNSRPGQRYQGRRWAAAAYLSDLRCSEHDAGAPVVLEQVISQQHDLLIGQRRKTLRTAPESGYVGLPAGGGAIDAVENRCDEIIRIGRPQRRISRSLRRRSARSPGDRRSRWDLRVADTRPPPSP